MAAHKRAIEDLQRIQSATTQELGIQDAAIYGAQIAVLQDPDAHRNLERLVHEEKLQPESAVQALLDKFEGLFKNLEGGDRKNWVADLRDPWLAVIRELGSAEEDRVFESDGSGIVLIAEELTPSLVTRHHRHPLAGIICSRGGRFSHGAVLARSFGIPTVTGIEGVHAKAESEETCLVYGDEGRAVLGATSKQEKRALGLAEERRQVQNALAALAIEPGRTEDGAPISIMVNIESPNDLRMFDPGISAGVGLFRTEFAYMERPAFPTVEEQAKIYESVLESFEEKPVVFRTLDIGGDKQLRYFGHPKENNPAMGWRGLRLSLEWQDLFLMQLSALVQARKHGDVRILLPMITTVEELRRSKELLSQVVGKAEPPPMGVMVEVPAAAMALRDIAQEADFVSVGTNDLAQYLFAVDRDNPWVADLYQPYHPAHLRVLRYIARTCNALHKPVSVCGEMAGQLPGALFLAGAGFGTLSIAPPFVAEVKAVLQRVSADSLRQLANRAAACHTSSDALSLLQVEADRLWAEVVESTSESRS
jgi:phosphoenolpyruvate-protein phosphotransferase|tara:strand:- start:1101 stop:2708 length:1608 start_codon:yes stop_codon:yes gene_type:complete